MIKKLCIILLSVCTVAPVMAQPVSYTHLTLPTNSLV